MTPESAPTPPQLSGPILVTGASGYVVTPIAADAKQPAKPSLVEVRLSKTTTGPVEVRLACRRDYDPVKDQSWCELAGFEVIGAARQWGDIFKDASIAPIYGGIRNFVDFEICGQFL